MISNFAEVFFGDLVAFSSPLRQQTLLKRQIFSSQGTLSMAPRRGRVCVCSPCIFFKDLFVFADFAEAGFRLRACEAVVTRAMSRCREVGTDERVSARAARRDAWRPRTWPVT